MNNIKSKKIIKKILAVFVLIMLFFTNYGMPLYAVAAETAELFESTLFRKEELSMTATFSDAKKEKEANVNEQVTMTVEINPLVDGYLKQGLLSVELEDTKDYNFKIVSISQEGEDESNSKYNSKVDSNVVNSSSGITTDKQANLEEDLITTKELDKEYVQDDVRLLNQELNKETIQDNSIIQNGNNEVNSEESTSQNLTSDELPYVVPQGENPIGSNGNDITVETVEEIQSQITTQEQTIIINKDDDFVTDDLSEIATEDVDADVLVNEEDYINQVHTDTTQEQIKRIFIDASSVTLKSNNQVLIENVSSKTKINITIAYQMSDVLNVDNLQEELNIVLAGSFVNEDLEEVQVKKSDKLSLGWKYNAPIGLTSEYTKISPFTVNNTNGTIVENEIHVIRNIDNKKYLPLKSTKLEIKIPTLNNNKPMMVDVMSKGLMATKGESIENLTFDKSNWSYDKNSNTITIEVENLTDGKVLNTEGEDIYVISYRYENYVNTDLINLAKNVKLTAEEYSNNINTIVRDLSGTIDQEINAGEIISYSMASNDSKISKSNIYANYFVDDKKITEFSSIVSLKILTQDMLDKVTLFDMQETYIDKDQNAYKASDDVTYKAIKFKYKEIEELLAAGTNIIVLDSDGNELYKFTKENTTNDETSKVTFEGDFKNIQVSFDNVSSNSNVNIEFVKEIKQSNYTMYQYTMFAKLQSSLRAKIKYTGLDEEYNLKEINDTKDFSESYTKANIYMNPASLNTLRNNENIEIKISLNNDQKTSDIYKNPGFEIVFPEYISDIDIQNIKIVNNENLRIEDFRTYELDNSLRIKVILSGVEDRLNATSLTGGTNILINCNIDVSEFAPKKEDEIKLYYYNEAVSNYWTQTMWKINESAPSGLIRATNGFDAYTIEYQAPSGFVNAVGIRNYDGMLGFVSSVKQGIVTAEIKRNAESQIATMELTTLNNTSNPCSDLVLLGRIPFKGNKDVITGEDLGTTVDTKLVGMIRSNQSNPYNSIIYYSTNENANKNLNDASNNWVEASYWKDLTKAKSYLIVVKGTIKPGDIYKYSYPFSIPEDLTFDNKIYGSFGAYYNNISSTAVVYESSSSDKVGLTTGDSPNLEVKLESSKGENSINGYERLTYTATVINTGSTPMENVELHYSIPENTVSISFAGNMTLGDMSWMIDQEEPSGIVEIGRLEPNESYNYSYTVKTLNSEAKEDIYIQNQVEVISSSIVDTIKSNVVKNKLVNSSFDKYIRCVSTEDMKPDDSKHYDFEIVNVSNKKLENAILVFHFASFEKANSAKIVGASTSDNDEKVKIDNSNLKVTFNLGTLYKNNNVRMSVDIEGLVVNSKKEKENIYYEVYADNILAEKSTVIEEGYRRPSLIMNDTTTSILTSINEDETFTLGAEIINTGNYVAQKQSYEIEYDATCLVLEGLKSDVFGNLSYTTTNGKVLVKVPNIDPQVDAEIVATFRALNLPGDKNTDTVIKRAFYAQYQNDQKLEDVAITIVNNKQTQEEKEQEEEQKKAKENQEKAKEAKEKYQQEESKKQNTTNNNSNNVNNTNNTKQETSNQNIRNDIEQNNNVNNPNNEVVNNSTPVVNYVKPKYSITGAIWIDDNKNGSRENEEVLVKDTDITLVNGENGTFVATTKTNGNGRYSFSNVDEGIYYVIYSIDNEKYLPTIFQNVGVDDTRNSDATLSVTSNMLAVTPIFSLTDNLDNVDLGLVEKSGFDIEVTKYLVGATVTYKNGNKVHYDYNKKEIAKIEIKSRNLNGATVELEYQIDLKNVGKVEGYAEQLIDIIPNDMENSQKNNGLWSLGTDGKLYSQNLANIIIKPGETRSLGLVLVKNMTNDNTGVVSNRAELISSISNEKSKENDDNNSHVQNTFIMPATGSEATWISYTLIGIYIVLFSYLLVTKKLKIDFRKIYR